MAWLGLGVCAESMLVAFGCGACARSLGRHFAKH